MEMNLAIPETVPDGSYEVVAIPYEAETGRRLDSLKLGDIEVQTAVSHHIPAAPPAMMSGSFQPDKQQYRRTTLRPHHL